VFRTFFHLQTVLSSNLMSENINIKIYITIIMSVMSFGCETLCLTFREARQLMVFENRVLRKVLGSHRDEITGQ